MVTINDMDIAKKINDEKRHIANDADVKKCANYLLAVNDVLELIGGKWRLYIIMALMCGGTMRFKQLQRSLPGISGKVLAQILKELEANDIVERAIYDTYPITVEYSLTPYGHTLKKVVDAILEWGTDHRQHIMNSTTEHA